MGEEISLQGHLSIYHRINRGFSKPDDVIFFIIFQGKKFLGRKGAQGSLAVLTVASVVVMHNRTQCEVWE
jgi:hypothetical protein